MNFQVRRVVCCFKFVKNDRKASFISVSVPGFFPDPDQPFLSRSGSDKNPDPWKKRPKTRIKVLKKYRYLLYFISCTLNIVLFGQAPPKPYQKSSFRSYKFIHGRIRIRTFKTRIRIGKKSRIHPDPDLKHCFLLELDPELAEKNRSQLTVYQRAYLCNAA